MAKAMQGAIPAAHQAQVQAAATSWGTFASGIQNALGPAQTLLRAIGPLGDAAFMAAERVERGALAMEAMGRAAEGAKLGLGGAVAIVGTVVAALAALALVLEAVHKGWELLKDSIREAAQVQTLQTTFVALSKSAEMALAQFEEIKNFWAQSGIFKLEDLTNAAVQLQFMGVNAQNTTRYVEHLAEAAAAVKTSVTSMADAFESIMFGRIYRPTQQTFLLMQQMTLEIQKTNASFDPAKIREWIQQASNVDRLKIVSQAMRDIGTEGNVAFDSISKRQKDFEGALARLNTQWLAFKEELGRPIIDALTPLINTFTEKMASGKTVAEEWGNTIAQIIRQLGDDIKAGNLGEKLADAMIKGLLKADWTLWKNFMTNIFYDWPKYIWDKFVKYVKETRPDVSGGMGVGGGGGTAIGGGGIPTMPPQIVTPGEDAAKAVGAVGGMAAAYARWQHAIQAVTYANDNLIQGVERTNKKLEDQKSDTAEIVKYWEDYKNVQVYSTSAAETNERIIEDLTKAIHGMADPLENVKDLMPGLTPDQAKMAQAIAQMRQMEIDLKNIDTLIKGGQATWFQGFQGGIMNLQKEWGNFAMQVEKATEEIGKALENDISTNLADILDGTKSVSQGFKDMAISILKDIERIIIRMLVVEMLQKALGFWGGGSAAAGAAGSVTGGSVGMFAGAGSAGAGTLHSGGMIQQFATGGRVALKPNEVPIIAEAGEVVFTQEQARHLMPMDRTKFLPEQLRAMRGMTMLNRSRRRRFHPGGGVVGAGLVAPDIPPEGWEGGSWDSTGHMWTGVGGSGGTSATWDGGATETFGTVDWGGAQNFGTMNVGGADIAGFGGDPYLGGIAASGGMNLAPPIDYGGGAQNFGSMSIGGTDIATFGGDFSIPTGGMPSATIIGYGANGQPIIAAVAPSMPAVSGGPVFDPAAGSAYPGAGTGRIVGIYPGTTTSGGGFVTSQVPLTPNAPFSGGSTGAGFGGVGPSYGGGAGYYGAGGAGAAYAAGQGGYGYGSPYSSGGAGQAMSGGFLAGEASGGIGMSILGGSQGFLPVGAGGLSVEPFRVNIVHAGGVIPSFQQGGVMPQTGLAFLHAGEQVTPASNISNTSSQTITNQITVHVEYKDGAGRSSVSGMGDREATDMARFVSAMVDKKIADNRRFGKQLYQNRDQRNPAAA
jgi:hypothetical protein